jgi:hypothetical protein
MQVSFLHTKHAAAIARCICAWLLALHCALHAEDAAPVQTEMQKWIATTDAQWQAAYQHDVTDVHEVEAKKLMLRYLNMLEEAIGKASKASDLDGAVALRAEQKRFGDSQLFPQQDEVADTAAVKQARAAIRVLLAQAEKNSAVRVKALHAKYDQVLAQAQTQLTQRQRLDDALLVKAKRDEVAAAWLTPAVAVLGKTGEATQPGTAGKGDLTGAPIPAPGLKPTAPPTAAEAAKDKTFEMRMTGTTWSFPWDGKVKSIRFEENGRLAMDFLGLRRKWKTPSDGVIEAFAFATPSEKDTIYIDASERTGRLTRRGKEYSIQRQK